MKKLIQADAVATLVRDGATIGVSGILLSGFAEEVAIALEKSFLATGHPRDLTLVHGAGIGNWTDKGTHHFGHEKARHSSPQAHRKANAQRLSRCRSCLSIAVKA
jgi:propionate CoA-transferase